MPQDPYQQQLQQHARELRKTPTDTERILWYELKNRRFQNNKFRRQHPFHHYILDFYCHEFGLVIELDGGQHNTPEAIKYDQTRTEFLYQQGLAVLRFWNDDVLKDKDIVMEVIFRKIEELRQYNKQSEDWINETLTPALSQREGGKNSNKT